MADIQINSTTAGNQQTSPIVNPQPRQAIAIDPSGNFVVAWTDANALDTSGAGVFVRRFDSVGNALTAETPVNITTSGDQQYVNLGMKSGGGEFVVTWTSAGQDGSGNGIFARLFNADGTPNGTTEIAVNAKTQGAQEFSTVAVDQSGNFIVVWTSATALDGMNNVVSGDGAGKGIFARRFQANGTPIDAQEFQVNTTTASDQQQAIVAMDGTGNFIVVWASSDGAGTGIYARRYTSAGAAGNEFQVNTFTAGNQSDPSIATDNNGNFIITWTSENQDGSGTGIFAQRLALADIATNPNGVTTVGSEFQVNPATTAGATGNQAGSSVAADSTGGFVVTWQSPGDTSGTGVFFQRYTTAGETLDNGQINTFFNGNQQFSSVDIRANGDIVTAWTSGPSTPAQDGAGTGVFASVLPALPKLTLTLQNDPFSENGGVAKVIATLDTAATAEVTVNLSFAGTAIQDSDYSPAALFITIPVGATEGFITLTGLNDINAEGDESVIVNVTSAVNAAEVGVQTVTATVQDDEPVPNLVIDDVSVLEGDTGITDLVFTVTLSAPSAQLVTVDYSTADVTATAGSDYIAASGTLSFNSGVLTQTITISLNGDTTIEDIETFFVNLSNATNATITDNQGIGTIQNDDFPIISIAATDASAAEPNLTGTYRITRTGSTTGDLTVNLSVDIGSTAAPSDYILSGGSVTGGPSNYTVVIPNGQTFVDVTLTPQDDTAIESNETLQLNVTSGAAYSVDGTNNFAVVTIADNDAPQISITALDASAAEPNLTGVYRLTRTSDTSASLAVNLTVDGSSTASASDYNLSGGAITGTAPNFTVNFLAGQSTVDITLTPVDDVEVEGAETVTLNVASNVNYTIDGANSAATVTITDNDVAPLPTVTLGLTGSPLAEAGGVATVTATLSQVSAQDVTVNLGFSGTATGGGTDYTAANTIVITAGNLSASTTITGVDDSLIEGSETVIVDITSVTNATESGVQTVTTTITDDEPVPNISINDVSIAEGNAGTSNLVFTVSLSAPSGQTITVDFSTADGTATTTDNDYSALTGTVTFTPGQTTQTITIPINGDTKFEPNETFTVNLSNVSATGAIADSQGIGTITNDDAPPTVTLGLTGSPLAEAGGVATVTATLSEISTQDVTVNLGFSGTATGGGTDYTAANAIVITAGNLSASTTITGVDDSLIEGSETVIVDITSVTNGTESGVQTVTATIADDESPPLLSINDVSIVEGNAGTSNLVFTVSLSAASTQTVTVDFNTADGTATTTDNDYSALTGTLTFTPGQTTQTITIPINGDTKFEPNETFTVNLSNVSATGAIADSQGIGTITNDDAPPTVTLGLTGSPLAEAGGVATVTATLSQVSAQDVTVNLGFSGTATGGGTDYTAANAIVITAGNLSASTTITGADDSLIEGSETVIVDITSVTNATESGVQTVTATITDDEPVPNISINDVSIAEGNAGTSNLVFTVSLSAPSGQTITVDFSTANGTATVVDNDYSALTGTVTFTPGQTTQTITIPINGDTKFEPNETFTVNLSNVSATGAIADSQGIGTITNDDAPPTVTLGLTGSPLAEAGGVATVTATLSEISTQDVTVNLGFSGTATGGGTDYTAANAIVITAGNLSASTTITGVDDSLIEGSETVIVDITSVTNATESGVQTVTATIADDESPPLLSINDVSIVEGNAGTSNLVFTVSLSAPSGQTITVDFSTANGTATVVDNDYSALTGTLTFTPGQTTQTITIPINGDTKFEPNETFTVNLSNVSATGAIADSQGIGTITNDDAPPTVTLGLTGSPLAEAGGVATVTATLSQVSTQDVTVNLGFSGTATGGGTDYTAANTIVITAGNLSASTTITGADDSLIEGSETVIVDITSVTNGTELGVQTVTATIADDESVPLVSINDVSIVEGNAGTSNLVFTVTLSAASTQTVTVDFSTANGTATIADNDYSALTGTLTFAPNEVSKTITIPINGDTKFEPNETFTVNLSNVSATGAIADSQGTGTITNDDAPPTVTLGLTGSPLTEVGGVATVTATLSQISTQDVTVNLGFSGTATGGGTDYNAAANAIVIAAGTLSASTTITAVNDSLIEGNETVIVDITSVTNGTESGVQTVTATITDDELVPNISINDVSIAEGNAGTTNLVFTVSLSAPSTQTVTVDFGTANGTATAGSDYTAASGTLTFTPGGPTSQTVTVVLSGDTVIEANETLFVNLANATNATITDNQGLGTIQNDDFPVVSITAPNPNAAEPNITGTYTVTRTGDNSVGPLTVNLTVGSSTASASDYILTGGSIAGTAPNFTVTIPVGQSSVDITLTPQDDTALEAAETLQLNIAASAGYSIDGSSGSATITIADNDTILLPVVGITALDADASEPGANTATYRLTRSLTTGSLSVGLTVDPSSTASTADYALSGVLGSAPNFFVTFADGQSTIDLVLTAQNDAIAESAETLQLNVASSASYAVDSANRQAIVTITDDDIATLPTVRINDVTLTEGNSGTTNVVFTVTLSAASLQTITVDFSTADGTATVADNDYTPVTGTLTFAPGQVSKNISIPVNGDIKFEPNETFSVNLSNPSATVAIADGIGVATIINNDSPPTVSLALTGSPIAEAGGIGTVTATLSQVSTQDVTVNLGYSGSATGGGVDYTNSGNSIVITAGNLSGSITLTAVNDSLSEGNESITVDITSVVNGSESGVQSVTAIISDDDANQPPVVTTPIPDQIATEDTLFSLTLPSNTFTDPNVGDTLTYSARLANGSLLPTWLTFNPTTLSFSGTPQNGNVGTFSIRVTARDNAGVTANDVFNLVVNGVNDPPVLTLSRTAIAYSGSAISIDPNLLLSDIDSPQLTTAAIAITGYVKGEDSLSVSSQSGITSSFNVDTGILTLSGAASVASYQAALRTALYRNNSTSPSGTSRQVVFTVSDGTDTSVPQPVQINLPVGVPVIDLNGAAAGINFATSGNFNSAIPIVASDLTIFDSDGSDISSVRVVISNPLDWLSEQLSVDVGNSGLSVTYKADAGTLAIEGLATTSTYERVLRTLTYRNGAIAPDNTLRKIIFIVSDGVNNSLGAETTLTLTAGGGGGGGGSSLQTTPNQDTISAPTTDNTISSLLANLQQADFVDGGAGPGIDTFILQDGTGNATVDVSNATSQLTGIVPSSTRLVNFERFDFSGFGGNVTMLGSDLLNDVLTGGAGNDSLQGRAGDDILTGNGGNDQLDGGTGIDTMTGGAGNDSYVVDNVGDAVIEAANQGTDRIQSSLSYTLGANLEDLILTGSARVGRGNTLNNRITGNSAANVLIGSSGNDIILGNSGNDRLTGDAGNDVLTGGLGRDTLLGGQGRDRFVIAKAVKGDRDVIRDFKVSDKDLIQISRAGFSRTLKIGTLKSSQFVVGTKALDSRDRFIYNASKGVLSFDSDGSGSKAAIQIAIFNGKPNLTAKNIAIIA